MNSSPALAALTRSTSTQLAEIACSSDINFFKPVDTDVLVVLFADYRKEKLSIQNLCQLMSNDEGGKALNMILKSVENHGAINIQKTFDIQNALAYLNAQYWDKALSVTDVKEYMSQVKRKEWDDSIGLKTTPEFEESVVVLNLKELLCYRDQFFAQTVDAIFQGLSGAHVTNQPMGFSKRMIMPSLYGKGEAEPTSEAKGYTSDLRNVIAKLTGRERIGLRSTSWLLKVCAKQSGKWVEVDGGAMKVKVFKVGTVHIEIHPDMAWRLNKILAMLYPMAIPSKFKKPHVYKEKEIEIRQRLISGDVICAIAGMVPALGRIPGAGEWVRDRVEIKNHYKFDYSLSQASRTKTTLDEAANIMMQCGLVRVDNEFGDYVFEVPFDFEFLQSEIVTKGFVPETKSHQYYPTNAELAKDAVDWCGIEEGDSKLEPSAGQGNIANEMGPGTVCVELSPIHCAILKGYGFETHEADFTKWAKSAPLFNKIIMNPPFSDGRARTHLDVALSLLTQKGVLVAVLPSSMRNTLNYKGYMVEYGKEYARAFTGVGTNVSVIMVKITKN